MGWSGRCESRIPVYGITAPVMTSISRGHSSGSSGAFRNGPIPHVLAGPLTEVRFEVLHGQRFQRLPASPNPPNPRIHRVPESNPLLIAAGFPETDVAVPWLGGKRLHFNFGS